MKNELEITDGLQDGMSLLRQQQGFRPKMANASEVHELFFHHM
jgi:hypothetical protein